MFLNKIEKKYVALILSVCLLAGLTLSYRVFAAELNKNKAVQADREEASNLSENTEMEDETLVPEEPKAEVPAVEPEKIKAQEVKKVETKKDAEKKKEAKKEEKKKEKKAEDKKKNNAFGITMTEKDLNNLYRLVQSEVGYMNEKSKMLVASVVLNRVNHKKFPNTVSEVVLQKIGRVYQFSPVAPGKRFWTCTVSKETKAAVDKVLKNGDYSKGALYFVAKRYTTKSKGSWFDRNLAWLSHHEGQDYYKER